MLTRLRIRNFKKFKDVDIELGQAVVLIGPNNSGKTAALQALALWDIGRRRWTEKRGKTASKERPGVAVNRFDLVSIPVPVASLLWRDLHVRDVRRAEGKQRTSNVLVEVVVDGVTNDRKWTCGLEFNYANEESFYCRPLRQGEGDSPTRMVVPPEANAVSVAFLPPMSGLAAVEPKLEPGRINVLIAEGQTAQVLRNLCSQIYLRAKGLPEPANGFAARDTGRSQGKLAETPEDYWDALVSHIRALFGVTILPPTYVSERGEIGMAYKEQSGIELDISSSGRGLQQTLLLLAHLYENPGTVLLLDEPDAHLEILRQRQIYKLLTDVAGRLGSQVVAASHSEVVLNEAAGRDVVVAFVGKPHRIDDRGFQVLKSLRDIGFEQYYMAQQKGWVLYLEGSTDLAILQAFARVLGHEATAALEDPFPCYVCNQASFGRKHFRGLQEAHRELVGAALYDRSDFEVESAPGLTELMWRRREMENYLCSRPVLLAYARGDDVGDLFSRAEADHRVQVMESCIAEIEEALKKTRKPSPWSPDIKASDDFLDPLFENYFEKLGMPNQMRKTNYHVLARFVRREDLDPKVVEKLDAIVKVAMLAKPAAE